jgi:hypothetical protein
MALGFKQADVALVFGELRTSCSVCWITLLKVGSWVVLLPMPAPVPAAMESCTSIRRQLEKCAGAVEDQLLFQQQLSTAVPCNGQCP